MAYNYITDDIGKSPLHKNKTSITKFVIKRTLREGGWVDKFLSVGDTKINLGHF